MIITENRTLVSQKDILPRLRVIMESHSIGYETIFDEIDSHDVVQYQFMIALLFTKLSHSAIFEGSKSLLLHPFEIIFQNTATNSQITFKYKHFEAVYNVKQGSMINAEDIKISDLVLRILCILRERVGGYDSVIKMLEKGILVDRNSITNINEYKLCLN